MITGRPTKVVLSNYSLLNEVNPLFRSAGVLGYHRTGGYFGLERTINRTPSQGTGCTLERETLKNELSDKSHEGDQSAPLPPFHKKIGSHEDC